MEKKNELAKEERTIFIVLAIIILIAIGVLVTWYFTKDKEAEKEKNEIKKSTETVDKQKKKDTDDDTGSTYTLTTNDNQTEEVVVLSANVVPQEEVKVVEVAEVEEGIGNVEPIESINYDYNIFYLIGEKINVANFTYDNEGTLTEIKDGKIINVALYDETTNEATMDAAGRYTIVNDNVITFNEDGIYAIDIQNSDGTIHTVYAVIFANDDLLLLIDSLKKEVNELEAIKYYDQIKYMEFMSAYAEFSKLPLDVVNTDLKNAYIDTVLKYNELCLTFNQELYESDHKTSSSSSSTPAKTQAQIDQENVNEVFNSAIDTINDKVQNYASLSMDATGNVTVNISDPDTNIFTVYKDIFATLIEELDKNKELIELISCNDQTIKLNDDINSQIVPFVKAALKGLEEKQPNGQSNLSILDQYSFAAQVTTVNGTKLNYTVTFNVPAKSSSASSTLQSAPAEQMLMEVDTDEVKENETSLTSEEVVGEEVTDTQDGNTMQNDEVVQSSNEQVTEE